MTAKFIREVWHERRGRDVQAHFDIRAEQYSAAPEFDGVVIWDGLCVVHPVEVPERLDQAAIDSVSGYAHINWGNYEDFDPEFENQDDPDVVLHLTVDALTYTQLAAAVPGVGLKLKAEFRGANPFAGENPKKAEFVNMLSFEIVIDRSARTGSS